MTYPAKYNSADMSVSLHLYSGESSGTFTYSTPSSLGTGITRPSSTQFTLAAGRHYLVFGSFSVIRTGTITSVDVSAQWHNGSAYIGKKGSIRLNVGDATTTPSYVGIKRNPTYRAEAVTFIRSSDISGSLTITLKRLSEVDGNGLGNFSYTNGLESQAAVLIMSIPA